MDLIVIRSLPELKIGDLQRLIWGYLAEAYYQVRVLDTRSRPVPDSSGSP